MLFCICCQSIHTEIKTHKHTHTHIFFSFILCKLNGFFSLLKEAPRRKRSKTQKYMKQNKTQQQRTYKGA